jgi:hypothetical protein
MIPGYDTTNSMHFASPSIFCLTCSWFVSLSNSDQAHVLRKTDHNTINTFDPAFGIARLDSRIISVLLPLAHVVHSIASLPDMRSFVLEIAHEVISSVFPY